MSNREVVQECVWECRRTKIELEHEVLLREMDVALVGMAGLPIAVVTIALEFQLWQNASIMMLLTFFSVVFLVLMEALRSDRKEKLVAKQKELDTLILEITKSSDQVSKSR